MRRREDERTYSVTVQPNSLETFLETFFLKLFLETFLAILQ